MSAPLVFDRPLLRRRLDRALAGGYAGFLLDHAVQDLALRLAPVTRDFSLALDLGTPLPDATRWLEGSGRAERVVRAAAVPGDAGRSPTVVADEEALPFAGPHFDLAVSLMSLHGVNDLPGALVQVRRALKPDGLFVGCLLGGGTLSELRQALMEAETDVEGGVSPRVAPYLDVRDAGSLMQRAGFALPVIDLEPLTVRYADPFGLLRDLRAMGLTNALVDRRRTPLRRATLLRAMEIYAERFADPDGRVRATFEFVWLLGWAPHESQQKPLRPGSARMRLADALGTTEYDASGKPRAGGGSPS